MALSAWTSFGSDEYSLGSIISQGWTNTWLASGSRDVVEDELAEDGRAAWLYRAGTHLQKAIVWDLFNSDSDRADAEVVMRLRLGDEPDANTRPKHGALIRGDGGYQSEIGYVAAPSGNGGVNVSLYRYSAGTRATLATVALPAAIPTAAYYRMRFRCITNESGNVELSAKVWADSDPEPATWNVTYTDVSEDKITDPGEIGIYAYQTTFADWIGVATGGGTAPTGTEIVDIEASIVDLKASIVDAGAVALDLNASVEATGSAALDLKATIQDDALIPADLKIKIQSESTAALDLLTKVMSSSSASLDLKAVIRSADASQFDCLVAVAVAGEGVAFADLKTIVKSAEAKSIDLLASIANVQAEVFDLKAVIIGSDSVPLDLKTRVRSVQMTALDLLAILGTEVTASVDLMATIAAGGGESIDLKVGISDTAHDALDLRARIASVISDEFDLSATLAFTPENTLDLKVTIGDDGETYLDLKAALLGITFIEGNKMRVKAQRRPYRVKALRRGLLS
jgi:hypothetical protein